MNKPYTIRAVIWTCPVTFKKRKAYRLWIGDHKLAAWSWPTISAAKKAAKGLAERWPAPIVVA